MNRELKEHLEREKYRGNVSLALALLIFVITLGLGCWAAIWLGSTL